MSTEPAWQNQKVAASTKKDRQATDPADTPLGTVADATLSPRPCRDPLVICDVTHSLYQHVWGGYLALARHFEAADDTEQAAIYNGKFRHFCRFELDLWQLGEDEARRLGGMRAAAPGQCPETGKLLVKSEGLDQIERCSIG